MIKKMSKKQKIATGIALVGSAFLGVAVPPELVMGVISLMGWAG